MDADRGRVDAGSHEANHGGPRRAGRMLQRSMEAKACGRGNDQSARPQIGFDERSLRANALVPDLQREGDALAVFTVTGINHTCEARSGGPVPAGGHPDPTTPQHADHLPLRAAGVALQQNLAVTAFPDGEAWRPIAVYWTPGHPGVAGTMSAESAGNRFGSHDASRGKAGAFCTKR